jgi:bis(5'-nucleosidyl)-tetraphosphatase
MLQEKSCGAVVFKRNSEVEYLLLHYEAGHWDFVKGNVETNESEKDTAIRELREETGIVEAHFIEGFRETTNYFYKRGSKTIHKEVVFFLIQAESSKVKLSYEHTGYEWLNYQKATEKLTFETAKKVLEKANELLKST